MNFGEIPWIADHTTLYRSDPEKAHMWDSSALGGPGVLPTLLLTTTGRKSGEKRDSPLIYGKHGDGFVIIASKGGMPRTGASSPRPLYLTECLLIGPKENAA